MAARLLIHAAAPSGVLESLWLAALSRLRAAAPRTRVCIRDLQGRSHFVSDDAGALIDLPLPAGTYHVNVARGTQLRRYTVALQDGATAELHLAHLA